MLVLQIKCFVEESVSWGVHLFSVVHEIVKEHTDDVNAQAKLTSRLLKVLRAMGFTQNATQVEKYLNSCMQTCISSEKETTTSQVKEKKDKRLSGSDEVHASIYHRVLS